MPDSENSMPWWVSARYNELLSRLLTRYFASNQSVLIRSTFFVRYFFLSLSPSPEQTEEYGWLQRLAKGLTPYSRMASQVTVAREDDGMAIGLAPTHEYVPGGSLLAVDNDVMRDTGIIDEEVKQRGFNEAEGVKFRFTWR